MRPTVIAAFILGTPAFISVGLWAAAQLIPQTGLAFGNHDRAMGNIGDSLEPSCLTIYWGNAVRQGFAVCVCYKSMAFSRSWGWKKTNRHFQFDEAALPTQPDHDYYWNRFGLLTYNRFHEPEGYDEDDIWHLDLWIRHSLLIGATSGVFGCYMSVLFIRRAIVKRRKRLGGFPVIHSTDR